MPGHGSNVPLLLRPPGVYRPQADTHFVAALLRHEGLTLDRHVLDLCSGTGALAIAAAEGGAATVTAVDLSFRSTIATWVNTRRRGCPIRVHHGDLYAPVRGQLFDVIITNPPYVPAPTDELPRHRAARCWDAGPDGRALIDRICAGAPAALSATGTLALVQSEVTGVDETMHKLRTVGLRPHVAARMRNPFGPVLRARAPMLRERGLLGGRNDEELVLIVAERGA